MVHLTLDVFLCYNFQNRPFSGKLVRDKCRNFKSHLEYLTGTSHWKINEKVLGFQSRQSYSCKIPGMAEFQIYPDFQIFLIIQVNFGMDSLRTSKPSRHKWDLRKLWREFEENWKLEMHFPVCNKRHSWQGVPDPLFYEDPLYCLPTFLFQVFSNAPPQPISTLTAQFVALFLWVNWWSRHTWQGFSK